MVTVVCQPPSPSPTHTLTGSPPPLFHQRAAGVTGAAIPSLPCAGGQLDERKVGSLMNMYDQVCTAMGMEGEEGEEGKEAEEEEEEAWVTSAGGHVTLLQLFFV